jgi:hypothetical protein
MALAAAPSGYRHEMEVTRLGEQALMGWREKVATPIARVAPVRDDTARAAIGFAFFALSLVYVLKTIAKAAAEARR